MMRMPTPTVCRQGANRGWKSVSQGADGLPAKQPVDGTSRRLSSAWTGDRNEHCDLHARAEQPALSFRFKLGSSDLDNRAFDDLKRGGAAQSAANQRSSITA
jgi:hypothetical protein